jgi:hypothetical protein
VITRSVAASARRCSSALGGGSGGIVLGGSGSPSSACRAVINCSFSSRWCKMKKKLFAVCVVKTGRVEVLSLDRAFNLGRRL